AAPAARIVVYGGTCGKIQNLSPQVIFWKQISILGSTMGSDKDFADMLHFVTQHKIKPRIAAVFPLERVQEAIDFLASGRQIGKVVVRIS
ncbi:MAG: zinc-binding dehydrogenase, partial [Flavobacteriales bacterium]|nr:zinc-binding dehydrogenase [Flavobacteriales bacterium]MDW8410037.1 zinc-binding dehydrogenase [Flavobacteriales bacterium]